MGKKITHFEIIGKDAAKTRKFYADLFDWKVGEMMGPEMGYYSLVDASSSGVAVGIGSPEPGGSARTTAYVEVADLQATLDRAVAMGGTILMPPMEIPGVTTIAMFADPDGNAIGLTKAMAG